RRRPATTLVPYTTLFRSGEQMQGGQGLALLIFETQAAHGHALVQMVAHALQQLGLLDGVLAAAPGHATDAIERLADAVQVGHGQIGRAHLRTPVTWITRM